MICEPLVSVVVIGYNVEAFISECLASVAEQTYGNLDVICVDDGSSDATFAVMEQWQVADTRFSAVTQCNCGPYAARRVGLEKARGDYIVFVDGDDWVERREIETALGVMTAYDLEVVMFDCSRDFENGAVSEVQRLGLPAGRVLTRDEIETLAYPLLMRNTLLGSPWNKMFRRSVLLAAGRASDEGVRLDYAEDACMQLEVFDGLRETHYVSEPLYHYRVHSRNSLSRKHRDNAFFSVWKPLFAKKHPYAVKWDVERFLYADMFQLATGAMFDCVRGGGGLLALRAHLRDEVFREIVFMADERTLVQLGASKRMLLVRKAMSVCVRLTGPGSCRKSKGDT